MKGEIKLSMNEPSIIVYFQNINKICLVPIRYKGTPFNVKVLTTKSEKYMTFMQEKPKVSNLVYVKSYKNVGSMSAIMC